MQSLDTAERFGRLARERRRALGIRLADASAGASVGAPAGEDNRFPELPEDTKGTAAGGR